MHCVLGAFGAVGASLLALTAAHAQQQADAYPSRPVRLIVTFAPGGGTDTMARTFAQKFSEARGQPVVIDNRGGGGGTIGAEIAVRAPADGYTLCMVSTSYATNAAVFKLPYDPIRDISPVALVGTAGILLAVHPNVPAKTVKELVAYAKAHPGALNYASTGTGGNTHMVTELFNMLAGTKMTHVPYKGTGPALTDLLSGQVQVQLGTLNVLRPHVLAGRLRGLGVTSLKRSPGLPGVPPIAETLPGYEAGLWYGLWGPKNLRRDAVVTWNSEIRKAFQHKDIRERFATEGLEATDGPPDLLREVVARDVQKWHKVVQGANIPRIQ
jgi:tripartite-type tricarboxylate transporter receptor subunit TctC